jgi:MauM/NapG family ferredoxin protein
MASWFRRKPKKQDAPQEQGGPGQGNSAPPWPPQGGDQGQSEIPLEEREFNREGFLTEGYKQVLSFATVLFEDRIERVTGHNKKFIRPPGAVPEEEFLQKCTKCGLCVEACPNRALRMADGNQGILNLGYPYLEVSERPCVLCESLPCIEACADGALLPIRHDEIFLGKVRIHRDRCNAWQGEHCVNCEYGCPVPGAIIFRDNKPYIDPKVCVGCGICIHACVETPSAISFVPKKDGFPSFRLRSEPQKPDLEGEV